MLFNKAKYLAMDEKANALYASRRDLSERLRNVTSRMQTLKRQETAWTRKYKSRALPKDMEIEMRETSIELENLQTTYDQVGQACDEHGMIVQKCKEFLEDHGVKIPTPVQTVVGGVGKNFIGGA